MEYLAIDLFSGCGGLSEGLKQSGFKIVSAIEIDHNAVLAYKMNHPKVNVIEEDICNVSFKRISAMLNGKKLHLLAGCPPCQGFSSVRRLNKKKSCRDKRNKLILEYLRFVEELKPLTIMMENVPGLENYFLFNSVLRRLRNIGYNIDSKVVNVCDYGVPQNRRRLVLVGSKLGVVKVAPETNEKITVRDAIRGLESPVNTKDPLHRMYPRHTDRISKMISIIPKDGGSRKDLPKEYTLSCHKKRNIGFNDIYGRLRWDDYSNTITSGCLNPSKGRFLHPEENRTITAREAALLQSFPRNYLFPHGMNKDSLASLIGNALPPRFSFVQCANIKNHLDNILD